jgi:hypothetical protein
MRISAAVVRAVTCAPRAQHQGARSELQKRFSVFYGGNFVIDVSSGESRYRHSVCAMRQRLLWVHQRRLSPISGMAERRSKMVEVIGDSANAERVAHNLQVAADELMAMFNKTGMDRYDGYIRW